MSRWRWLVASGVGLAAVVGLAGCELGPPYADFVVDTTLDAPDAAIDGTCDIGDGTCSLRAAIDEANAYSGPDTPRVVVPAGTYDLTLTGIDDTNDAGDLDVRPTKGRLLIDADPTGAAIDADGAEHVLDVHQGLVVARHLGVRGASDAGVRVRKGITELERSSLHHNGAGLTVDSGAKALTTTTTISTNTGAGVTIATDAELRATATTIAQNTDGIAGTGTAVLSATIVTDHGPGADCATPVTTSSGHNADSDDSCGLDAATDHPDIDPDLGPLSTDALAGHAPSRTSPLIDTIPTGTTGACDDTAPTDQRSVPRPSGSHCEPGAIENTNAYTVDVTTDTHDTTPGDGHCDDGTGHCSLRAAIDETNTSPEVAWITLAPATTYPLSLSGDDDENAGGDLDIAPTAGAVHLSAARPGATIDAAGADGAIDVRDGNLWLIGVSVTGGSRAGLTARDGTKALTNTLAAHDNPGAGFLVEAGATATSANATFTTNGSTGIDTAGTLKLVHATVTANGAGGIAGTGTATVEATVVADQTAGADCTGIAATTNGYNLDSDGSCALTDGTDQPNQAPLLEPVSNPASPAHLPAVGSPLLDAIAPGASRCTTPSNQPNDQWGAPRPQGAGCEPGALERTPALSLTVDTPTDGRDTAPGDTTCDDGTGQCSLRAAIDETNARPGADTITIATGIDPVLAVAGGDEDTNATGDLDITDDLTLDGDGNGNGATIDADGLDRVLHVAGDAELTLLDATLTGGSARAGGGLRVDAQATATLRRATVAGNETTISVVHQGPVPVGFDSGVICVSNYGGSGCTGPESEGGGSGIWSNGTLHLDASTVWGNTGTGGGCFTINSTPTIEDTVCAHAVGGGVAMRHGTVVNSTISGNQLQRGTGAGLIIDDTAVTSSTIADNTVVTTPTLVPSGVQIDRFGTAPSTLAASIVAGDSPLCTSPVTSGGFNVIGDPTCVGNADATDLRSHDPRLTPLADDGGPTLTQPPALDSPARDLVPFGTPGLCDATTVEDQRGEPRPAGPSCDSGAVEGDGPGAVTPLSLVVTHGGDDVDAAPGDGVCQDASGAPGDCSLRAAVDEANAWPAVDDIAISPGTDVTLSRPGAGEDTNATGDLDVTGPLVLTSGGAEIVATADDRVLDVHAVIVSVTDTTLVGGSPSGAGGAVRTSGGTLDLEGSTITGGQAGTDGGGIALDPGRLQLVNTTVSGNAAEGAGGAVAVLDGRATLRLATIADNTAGTAAAVHRGGGTVVEVAGTVLDGVGADCSSPLTSTGHNVAGDSSCGTDEPTDQTPVATHLEALADNGGPTPTHLPRADAPSVDTIGLGAVGLCDGTVATDQRGIARPDGAGCDAGAVEGDSGSTTGTVQVVVTHSGDDVDATPGDGVCQDASGAPGACSLRAAVDEANAALGDAEITIDAGVHPVLSRAGAGEDANATGDLDVNGFVTILGGGASVDAAGLDRAFDVGGGDVALVDLHIQGGSAGAGDGGGIRAGAATLLVDGTTVTGSQATNGGGIALASTAATVVDTTVSGNEATSRGGGLHQAQGSLELRRASVTDNVAGSDGGGTHHITDGTASATIESTTVARNSGADGGGISRKVSTSLVPMEIVTTTIAENRATGEGGGLYVEGGSGSDGRTSLVASTVAANGATRGGAGVAARDGGSRIRFTGTVLDDIGTECKGGWRISAGYNLVRDASCGLGNGTDLTGVEPLLFALGDNGGPAPTVAPAANSPAVDSIPVGAGLLCDGSLPVDQRGQPRPTGAGCDRGAVEGPNPTTAAPLSLSVTHAGDDVDADPGDGVCQDAAGAPGACSLRAAVSEANAWPTPDSITIAAGVDPQLAIAGADEDDNASGDLDVLDALVIHGDGATVDAGGLDRVVDGLAELELVSLGLTGGATTGDGGGIRQRAGNLSLVDVTVDANHADGAGGGVHYDAPTSVEALDVADSTIANNSATSGGGLTWASYGAHSVADTVIEANAATQDGGGLLLEAAGTLGGLSVRGNTAASGAGIQITGGSSAGSPRVSASTIADNIATGDGGGIGVWDSGYLTLEASTVSGNQAQGRGGGLYTSGFAAYVDVESSTFAGNQAVTGSGGIHRSSKTVRLWGSVLADVGDDCEGTVFSYGYNVSSDASCTSFTQVGDLRSTDALLGPLADNGGSTHTHLPGAGSPVIDAVPPGTATLCDGTVPTDQRGVARPTGAACDIGSVEQ